MYKTNSSYPNMTDPLIFFSDTGMDQHGILQKYRKLIHDGAYDKANEYLSLQEEAHAYSADLFNMIENRIWSLQKYLLAKEKYNPHIHSENMPEQIQAGEIWVE